MEEKQWRWSLLNWILLWLLLAVALYLSGVGLVGADTSTTTEPAPAISTEAVPVITNPAGEPPYHTLRVYLRYSDGTAVTGESITLERLPQELPMSCVTDERGRCTWQVGRGLYQVLFERPLDQISALSLAEGGLRGFGLTVGEFDIAYHFVFYGDGRAYFDAAPDALRPKPILPQFQSIQGGTLPFIDEAVLPAETTGQTVVANTTPEPETAAAATSPSGASLLLLLGLGLLLGGGLHLLQRRWPAARLNRSETTAVNALLAPTGSDAPANATTIGDQPAAAVPDTDEEDSHA